MWLVFFGLAACAARARTSAQLPSELARGHVSLTSVYARANLRHRDHRDPDENSEWANQVLHSPVKDGVDWIGDTTGLDIHLDRPSDVFAYTCITFLVIFALLFVFAWYHLPDGGKCCGISTRSVKIALILLTWCLTGTAVMMFIEGYTLGTSVYIMAQIVTTIGYGDFTPSVWYTQLFMSFYVILCILVIAGVISSVADTVMAQIDSTMQGALETPGKSPRYAVKAHELDHGWLHGLTAWFDKHKDILAAAFMFSAMVAVGTIYYGGFQGCTCSYGKTAIQGCSEASQELCIATGGNDLTYMQAFYMSCITLTTVGFGDFTPMSQHGRIFAAFWMLLGVASMGNFVRAFSEAFMAEAQLAKQRQVDLTECFHKIDKNGDGVLDRYEFISFVLLEHGIVSTEMLDNIGRQYDSLDVEGNEAVTLKMIMEHETGGKVTIEQPAPASSRETREGTGASALLRVATQHASNR